MQNNTTTPTENTSTQPSHSTGQEPGPASIGGYSKIDIIGGPHPPLPRSMEEGETESCSADLYALGGPSTPAGSPKKPDQSRQPPEPPTCAKNINVSMFTYRALYLTELPFLIMWVYGTYWTYLVVMYAHLVRTMIWLSAAVAGILVGIGLNANAFEMLSSTGRVDYGVVSRFFIIPFGVSSLSGMTNQLRERFLLVFPRDPLELLIAILLPTLVVTVLFGSRLLILSRLPIPWNQKMIFLNTQAIKDMRPGKSLFQRLRGARKPKRGAPPKEADAGKLDSECDTTTTGAIQIMGV